jgi:hypothetical protein
MPASISRQPGDRKQLPEGNLSLLLLTREWPQDLSSHREHSANPKQPPAVSASSAFSQGWHEHSGGHSPSKGNPWVV